jgi:hypothetical protein
MFKALGCNAIEIGCMGIEDILRLPDLDASDIRYHFQHLSLHAPTDMRYRSDDETKKILRLMSEAHRRFQFDCVVIHPENVEDWMVLKGMPFPIGIENADRRKDFGKTEEDIEDVISGTSHGFVLDVNHCFSNDATMMSAFSMAANFSRKMMEIHVSGFDEYHEPLHLTKQLEILGAVPLDKTPIIIESACANWGQVKAEYDYVKKYFSC